MIAVGLVVVFFVLGYITLNDIQTNYRMFQEEQCNAAYMQAMNDPTETDQHKVRRCDMLKRVMLFEDCSSNQEQFNKTQFSPADKMQFFQTHRQDDESKRYSEPFSPANQPTWILIRK